MTEPMVPATGDAWVEKGTEYVIEVLENGRWEEDELADTADEARTMRKEMLADEFPEAEIRVVEVLTMRRVMLLGELEARADREAAGR